MVIISINLEIGKTIEVSWWKNDYNFFCILIFITNCLFYNYILIIYYVLCLLCFILLYYNVVYYIMLQSEEIKAKINR